MNTGEWGVVEMLGHRVLAGRVTECKRFGAEGAVVSVPAVDGAPAWETFVAGGSIYAVTPCSEAQALAYIRRNFVRPPAGLALPEPAQRGLFDAGAGTPEPDQLGMLEPIQSDDGAESWWGDHVASELVHILLEPGAFLECDSCRLAWDDDAQAYQVTSGDDSVITASDLLAALRELRGPEAVGAGEHETATATVVEDGPGF